MLFLLLFFFRTSAFNHDLRRLELLLKLIPSSAKVPILFLFFSTDYFSFEQFVQNMMDPLNTLNTIYSLNLVETLEIKIPSKNPGSNPPSIVSNQFEEKMFWFSNVMPIPPNLKSKIMQGKGYLLTLGKHHFYRNDELYLLVLTHFHHWKEGYVLIVFNIYSSLLLFFITCLFVDEGRRINEYFANVVENVIEDTYPRGVRGMYEIIFNFFWHSFFRVYIYIFASNNKSYTFLFIRHASGTMD